MTSASATLSTTAMLPVTNLKMSSPSSGAAKLPEPIKIARACGHSAALYIQICLFKFGHVPLIPAGVPTDDDLNE